MIYKENCRCWEGRAESRRFALSTDKFCVAPTMGIRISRLWVKIDEQQLINGRKWDAEEKHWLVMSLKVSADGKSWFWMVCAGRVRRLPVSFTGTLKLRKLNFSWVQFSHARTRTANKAKIMDLKKLTFHMATIRSKGFHTKTPNVLPHFHINFLFQRTLAVEILSRAATTPNKSSWSKWRQNKPDHR